ncbi:MAG TPA: restriction endonuclease [Fimbriimonadaceae bacterium]|nr:restriction endonuclease [Fimbriimonadaceae bacterium]
MAARKVTATKTTNPLHFEDLEPKRFEDLVRQLAYGFRSWKVLEPTGLLGDDEGIDILGVEATASEESPENRTWRFQCKRYRRLGPAQVRAVVREVVPDKTNAPHGLVIAAACNLTSDAILAFHDEAKKLGVEEAQFWSKAKMEDLLFQPENDHLLFAYFNISLRTRRRSDLERIRHTMVVKRKLLTAFGAETLAEASYKDVIVRDINDSHYPRTPPGKGSLRSWHAARALWANHEHLVLELCRWVGWRKPDGTWDLDEETKEQCEIHELQFQEIEEDNANQEESRRRHRERVLLEDSIPKEQRVDVVGAGWLPYAAVLEVDPIGDPRVQAPHLFCEYKRDANGPYEGHSIMARRSYGGDEPLSDEKRDRTLFKNLRASADLSEGAWDRWLERSTAELHGTRKR